MTWKAFILAALATAIGSLIAVAVSAAVARKYAAASMADAKRNNPLARLLLP